MDEKEMKRKIDEEIAETEKLIEEYRENSKPVAPDSAIGRITRMDAIGNKHLAENSLRQAEQKLTSLKIAAGKIGTADFGVCARCGNKIPLARILYVPESPFCVNCAR
ncbi:MAG: TraR/DksA C4-type zinc finger protein [Victivallaceae bacterium]